MASATLFVIGTAVMTVNTWFNQYLARKQQARFHEQQRADRERQRAPERWREEWGSQLENSLTINNDLHQKRIQEELNRVKLQERIMKGADPLLPGAWWESRRPRGFGPVVVVDIGPRTPPPPVGIPTTLDVPLDFLSRSLKSEYSGNLGLSLDAFSDRLCIDSDGVARGFIHGELRDRPAILIYGKASGNYIYVDAVFSQELAAPGSGSGFREENLAVFPRGFLSELATDLGLTGPRIFEAFDLVCDTVVNTKVLNLLDVHFCLSDGSYEPRAHEFFLRRRVELDDRGLWPKSNAELLAFERRMQTYPDELQRLRGTAPRVE